MTGRPRKAAARAPSGAISRAGLAKPIALPTWQRLRDEVILRSRDPELGTELGRLFLAGELTARQFEAGRRYGATVREAMRVIGLPCLDPGDKAAASTAPFPEPGSPEWDRLSDQGRAAAVTLDALAECLSISQRRSVAAVCVDGRALPWFERNGLVRGLEALSAQFVKMDARRKRA